MANNDRLEEILMDLVVSMENMEANIKKMEERDKCRYLCKDRGRHNVECDFYVQKGS